MKNCKCLKSPMEKFKKASRKLTATRCARSGNRREQIPKTGYDRAAEVPTRRIQQMGTAAKQAVNKSEVWKTTIKITERVLNVV